ncbi:unnamed protein product [Clonostachys rhizophaga]|uniref:Uncharacterized protein n=1 Tax=Clonostachys rhizophaga TaxID=160324 RepID=A0A9N9YK64_9HYPO|nr:unnamed protein product [Clonostachys rhizophaga]
MSRESRGAAVWPRRRKSLGNVMQTVRAKLSRSDKSSADFEACVWTREEDPGQSYALPKVQDDSDQTANIQSKTSQSGKIKVPQLEVLGGLACGNLTSSSTFRDGLERAADDINTKYQIESATATRNNEAFSQNKAFELAARGYRRIFSPSTSSFRRLHGKSSDSQGVKHHQVDAPSETNPSDIYRLSYSTKVPIDWLEKILETSIPLRTPWDCNEPKLSEMTDFDPKSVDIESASVIKHELSSHPPEYAGAATSVALLGKVANNIIVPVFEKGLSPIP